MRERIGLSGVLGLVLLCSILLAFAEDPQSGWQPKVVALEDELAALTAQVEDLQELLAHFSREGDDVFISGANLHLVNGLGATDTTNGLGNIIIGYNEERTTSLNDSAEGSFPTSSVERFIATHEEQWAMLDDDIADGIRRRLEERASPEAVDYRSGSHVLVVGKENNYSGFGGIVVGVSHDLSADWSSIVGGSEHFTRAGTLSTIIGGWGNFTDGDSAVVVGGQGGAANAFASLVAGGIGNAFFPTASHSSIVGGAFHRARAESATILGGTLNEAVSGMSSTIVGGSVNRSYGVGSTVVGGQSNHTRGANSVVVGGTRNRAEGEFSSVSEGCDRTVTTCGGP